MTTEIISEKKRQVSKDIKEPKKYKVIICNDDVTPVDFVIAMLITVFKHSHPIAENLTLAVHNNGSAVAGVYNHEIAEHKVLESTNMARLHGFPLLIKLEAE